MVVTQHRCGFINRIVIRLCQLCGQFAAEDNLEITVYEENLSLFPRIKAYEEIRSRLNAPDLSESNFAEIHN